jgi:RHS repeat-associated protein
MVRVLACRVGWSRRFAAVIAFVMVASLVSPVATPHRAAADPGGGRSPAPKPAAPTPPKRDSKPGCAAERPDESSARAMAKRCKQSVEVAALRTEQDTVYAQPDGTFRWEYRFRPVRVRKDRSWAAVDTTLRFAPDGAVVPVATAVHLRLSGGGDGPIATVGRDGHELSVAPPFGRLPWPVLAGSTATYRDALPGVDLEVTADVDGFRQTVVVKDARGAADPALAAVPVAVTGTGLRVRTGADGVAAIDDAGATVFESVPSRMADARTGPVRGVAVGVRTGAGPPALTPDAGVLRAAAFPIRITSGFTYHRLGAWASVSSDRPGAGAWNSFEDASAGAVGGARDRAFFTVASSQLSTDKRVRSATFQADPAAGAPCPAAGADLYRVPSAGSGWTWRGQDAPGNQVWRSKPVPAARAATRCAGLTWDVTKAVQGATVDRGALAFAVRARAEADPAGALRLANDPRLIVVFNTVPSAPTQQSTDPSTPCVTGANRPPMPSDHPTLRALVQDNDGDPMSVTFEWWYTGGAKIGSATVTGVASGTTAAVTVPDSTFSFTGTNYSWRVAANDGKSGQGPWSSWCEFTERHMPDTPWLSSPDPTFEPYGKPGQPRTITVAGPNDWLRFSAGHWTFNEGAGPTTADVPEGRSPLTLRGATWVTDAAGGSVAFNGTNQYAGTDRSVLATDESFTVAAWVKLTPGATGTRTVVAQEGNRTEAFALQYVGAQNRWAFTMSKSDVDAPDVARALSSAAPRFGVWTHLVGTFDSYAKEVRLYVDGAQVGSAPMTATPWNARGSLVVGRGKAAGAPSEWWSGGIDDVRALSWLSYDYDLGPYADVTGLDYQLDTDTAPTSVTTTGPPVLTIVPPQEGQHSVTVWIKDRYGQRSDPATLEFQVGTSDGPRTPTQLTTDPPVPCVTGPDRPHIASTTPTLHAFVDRPDGGWLSTTFQVQPISAGPGIQGWAYGQAGTVASYQVPPGKLADKATYMWQARSYGDSSGPPSAWCEFTVDIDKPAPPGVASTDYPSEGNGQGGPGQPGAFTFRQGVNDSMLSIHLPFNEGSGTVAGNDANSSAPVTLYGGAGWATGQSGASLSLGGNGGYAATDEGWSTISTDEDYTVGAWVKLGATTASGTVLSLDGTRQSGFTLGYSKPDNKWVLTHPLADSDGTAVARTLSSNPARAGGWTHLAAVHDAARKELRLYVDGRLDTTVTYSALRWYASGGFVVGRGRSNGGPVDFWSGQVDDVVAFRRTLPDGEVAGLADATAYQYQMDTDSGPTEIPATGPAVVSITPTVKGRRTLTVRAKDKAGNVSDPTLYRFAAGQLTAPEQPADPATDPPGPCATGPGRPLLNSLTPQLRATVADPNWDQLTTTFEWWAVGGDKIGEASAHTWSGDQAAVSIPAGGLADGGSYAWRAHSDDGTETGPWSSWCEFTVDVTAPGVPQVSSVDFPADGRPHGNAGGPGAFRLAPAGGTTDLAGYRYQLDADGTPTDVAATGPYQVVLTPKQAGTHTLTVTAKDKAGNVSDPAVYTFVVGPPAPYEYAYDGSGQLTGVIDPRGDAAAYDYDNAGNLLAIRRYDAGTLSVLATVPASAPPGAQVTVRGTGFASDDTVLFAGTPAQTVSATRTAIVVTVPAGAATGTLTVRHADGTSAPAPRPFTVTAPAGPVVSAVAPAAAEPGSTVTITGTGFDPVVANDTVMFNRTRARVTAASATSLTVVVPDAATAGRISVRTLAGLATSTADFVLPPRPYRLADVVDAGSVTCDGASVTATVGTAGKVALLRFDGRPGQKLSLGLGANSLAGTTKIALYTPYGQPFAADQYEKPRTISGNDSFALPPLPTAGTYQVVVDPQDTSTGSVTVTLSTQATGALTTTGAGTPVPLDRAGKHAELTFTATENEQFSFTFADWAFSSSAWLTVRLYTPYGTEHLHWLTFSNQQTGRFTTPWPGQWRIVVGVRDLSTGTATMWLSEELDGGQVTTGGAAVPVTMARPGQAVRLAFDGTAGQRLGVGLTDVTAPYVPALTLRAPDGAEQYVSGGAGRDLPPLPTTGRYQLIIEQFVAGSVNLWLSEDVDVGVLAVGGQAPVTIGRPGTNLRLRFDGTAGQTLSLGYAAKTFDSWLRVEVARSAGAGRLSSWVSSDNTDLPPLPDTGRYEVTIVPDSASTGTMTLVLSAEVDAGTVAVGGDPATVRIDSTGQNGRLRFDATTGQRISLGFTGATSGFDSSYVTVLLPDGSQLGYTKFVDLHDDLDLGALPATGTYQVVFDPVRAATGSVTVTASAEVDAGTVTVGGPGAPVTIPRPGQDGRLSFSGTAQQSLRVALSATTISTSWVWLSVFAPDSSTLVSSRFRADGQYVDLPPLPTTGVYAILVDPYDSGTGSTTLTVTSLSSQATPQAARAPRGLAVDGDTTAPHPVPTALDPEKLGCAGTGETTMTRSGPRPGAPIFGWRACGLPAAARSAALPGQHTATATRPANAAWTPDADNLAGLDWTTRYGPATVPDHLPSARKGTTGVAGQVRTVAGAPLAGVTVRVDKVSARTDAAGRFLLAGVRPGHRVVHVDGGTANGPGATYGVFDIGVDLASRVTLKLPYTIWMQPLDTEHAVRIAAPTTQPLTLTTPSIPGLEIHVPAGSVVRDGSGKVAHELSLTAIPIDRPPFPLPPSKVPVYFTVQPGGGSVFPDGVQVVYPNYTHEAPGTRMNFWAYDPDGPGWHVYGKGTVTPDAKQVVPDADTKVYRFTGAMTVVPGYNPPTEYPPAGGTGRGGDPVDLATGLLVDETTDLALDDTIPLRLTRVYQQGDVETRPFGIGTNFSYNIYPWSSAMLEYLEADVILPDGARVHFRRISPGSGPKSYASAIFRADPAGSAFDGATMAWSGDGWDVRLTDGTTYVIGDEGPLQAIRDRYGNTVTLTRAPVPPDANGVVRASGPITQITSPNGMWIKLSYDSSQRVVKAEDNLGRTVGYTYTPDGHLETVTNPGNGVTRYTYEGGRLKTVTDPRQTTYLVNEYDSAGRVHKQTAPDGGTYVFDYTTDTTGKVTQTKVTDPRGYARVVTFSAAGLSTSDASAVGTPRERKLTIERDPQSNLPRAYVDALNRRTELDYDDAGHVIKDTRLAGTPDATVTRFEYKGPFNLLSKATDALGHATVTEFHPNGTVSKITDPMGRTTTFENNDAGQVTKVTDNLGHTTTIRYEMGERVAVTDALGRTERDARDAAGRVVASTDADGDTSLTTYDALDQVRTSTDPLGRTTTFDYDPNGNPYKVIDDRNKTTTYEYDTMDRLHKMTDPLGATQLSNYDRNGNLVNQTSRNGKLTTFDYDELDRRKLARYGVNGTAAESQTSYDYDAGNRLRTITDSVAGTTTLEPDGLDRLHVVTTPQGKVTYGYDAAGRRRSIQVDGQPAIGYDYNDADQPTTITRGSDTVGYEYDDGGKLKTLRLPSGYRQVYDYDDANQVTGITYRHGDAALGAIEYGYDAAGRRTVVGGSFGRTAIPQPFGPATYDDANRLTTLGSTALSYDSDGNLISDGTSTNTWDARGQLAGVSGPSGAVQFRYDAFGRRIAKTAAGTTTSYLYDGDNPVQEIVGGSVRANILAGPGTDDYLARIDGTGTRTYLTDALGSTIALGDPSGTLAAQYTYDPFGATSVTGQDGGNPLRFTGREDDGTGLYNYRGRYYSPGLQRFISQDPLGHVAGDTNLYRYVGNQPTGLLDPHGTKPMRNPNPQEDEGEPWPPQWLKDRWNRGRQFNEDNYDRYEAREVILENGKVLDSYNPGRDIVSRKYSQLSDVKEDTAIGYLNELKNKYSPGKVIADVPYNRTNYPDLVGMPLQGKMVLEVPVQNNPVPKNVIDAANQRGITIRDVNGKVYS